MNPSHLTNSFQTSHATNQDMMLNSVASTSNSSTDNIDQIFSPNAWWRNFGSFTNISNNFNISNAANATTDSIINNLISNGTPSGNVIGQEIIPNHDSCSAIDWESFFAPSQHAHEPKVIATSYPQNHQPISCKITINPNCCTSNSNTFECNNNYSTTTSNATANNGSSLDGMITLLNRILVMNGVNPDLNQCQMSIPDAVTYQPNLESQSASYVTEPNHFMYAPIQSFDETQRNIMHTQLNSSTTSSDSDSSNSHHSSNSIGKDRIKICKKRSTRPRLKFQKETDKSIKFNLVTSEELAASLLFHETSVPNKKRNRGRPKKSESSNNSSPQKTKNEQSGTIEFMVNCYDQCSKIFK